MEVGRKYIKDKKMGMKTCQREAGGRAQWVNVIAAKTDT